MFYKKVILINFTKFTGKQLYRCLFFDNVLALQFKKRLADYRWAAISAKYPLFVTLTSAENVTPVDKGRKLNVYKTFRIRLGRLLNVLCTFNLRTVSTGLDLAYSLMINNKYFQSKHCESLRVQINKIKFVKLTHSLWKIGVAANNCCNKFCGIYRHL